MLPQLLTQEFFAAEGFDKLYRTLFTPQPPEPLISEEIYRSHVMPFMIKLWSYRQADIRLTIFRLFEVYLKAVVLGEGGSEVLAQIILPEVRACCLMALKKEKGEKEENTNQYSITVLFCYWL